MEKKSIPPEYWWGWKQSGYAKSQTEQRELEETLPPVGLTTNDANAVREMEESAFVVTTLIPAQEPSYVKVPTKYPDIQDFGDIDDDIKQRLIEAYKGLFEDTDKSKYRQHEFEVHRQDILKKLQSAELKEPVLEAKRRNEMMKYGMSLAEESQLDWEATVEETLGFELPEEERFVGKTMPPAPPPGPDPGGRGAFFVLCDGSGSMEQPCDTRGFNRFQVASAVIWTFIQEAKAINRGGRSHYIGIYGFDSCMYYPLPVSEYPPQPPLNPLPSDDILTIERDFLRYWPSTADSDRGWMGNTQWENTLPAFYADYIKFKGGDIIIICDGDVNSELSFFEGQEAGEMFEEFNIPKDKNNPTFLMKLQDFIQKNDCGNGYMFWLVPKFVPQYNCPKCNTSSLRVANVTHEEDEDVVLHYRCANGHEWTGDLNQRCPTEKTCGPARSRGGFDCTSCRYFHLVLGRLFNEGNHIFKGTTANELLDSVASAITDQRKRRLERGEVDDFTPQDDEED